MQTLATGNDDPDIRLFEPRKGVISKIVTCLSVL